MPKCYVITKNLEIAYEIKEKTFNDLWNMMEVDRGLSKAIHIIKGEENLKKLVPEIKIGILND